MSRNIIFVVLTVTVVVVVLLLTMTIVNIFKIIAFTDILLSPRFSSDTYNPQKHNLYVNKKI
jgi:hypothetical protein